MAENLWTVLYSHGKGGDPWRGNKIMAMREAILSRGCNIVSISYGEDESVDSMAERTLAKCLDPELVPGKLILLGSSRGAFVSAEVALRYYKKTANRVDGLFLIAAAVNIKQDYYGKPFPQIECPKVEFIHGYHDDTIPYINVVNLAGEISATLHLVDDDHRINNKTAFISMELGRFLDELILEL